jgi:hypothetical protein
LGKKKGNITKITKEDFKQLARDIMPVSKDMVLESTFDDGGRLNPEDAERFIDLIEEESDFQQYCTVHKLGRPSLKLTTLDMDGTVSVPKVEATATAIRNTPIINDMELTPTRYIAPVELSGEALEVNFEGGSFADHLMGLLAKCIRKDLNRIILFGDKTGVLAQDQRYPGYTSSKYMIDPFMKTMDGLLKTAIATGNIVDFSGFEENTFGYHMCVQMMAGIPEERRESIAAMKFFCSWEAYYDYIDTLAKFGKDTAAVQMYMEGKASPMFRGLNPIIPINCFSKHPKVSIVDSVEAGGTIQLDWFPLVANSLKVTPNSIGSTYTTPFTKDTDYTLNETTGLWTHDDSGGGIGTGTDLNLTYQGPGFVIMTDSTNTHLGIGINDMKMKMFEDVKTDTTYIVLHYKMGLVVLDDKKLYVGTGLQYKDYSEWTSNFIFDTP